MPIEAPSPLVLGRLCSRSPLVHRLVVASPVVVRLRLTSPFVEQSPHATRASFTTTLCLRQLVVALHIFALPPPSTRLRHATGASGWLSRRLTSSRRHLLSSRRSAKRTVVVLSPTPPCDFASTSSSPSGRHNSQHPTCRATAASRPLAASASRRATSAARRVAASQLAVSLPSPICRRCCCQCAGVFAVIAIAIVALGDCPPRRSSSSWCCRHRRRHRRHRRPSPSSSSSYPVAPLPSLSTSWRVVSSQS